MQKMIILVWSLFLTSLAHGNTCPDLSRGETMEDCPWADVARVLVKAAEADQPLSPLLTSRLPQLAEQMAADSKRTDWKTLWGESLNFDETVKKEIVHPAIVDMLLDVADVPPRQNRRVHAGIQHTYGYLFSLLQTPWGYKRSRWVRDDLESGFRLPRGVLGPTPPQGTLFSNVTYFFGRFAFQDEPEVLEILEREHQNIPRELRVFAFDQLKKTRLEEIVTFQGGRQVILRSDLVPFLNRIPERQNILLMIYSVLDSEKKNPQLITGFPAAQILWDQVLNPENLGENLPIITRYNAFVEGITNSSTPVRGLRRIR